MAKYTVNVETLGPTAAPQRAHGKCRDVWCGTRLPCCVEQATRLPCCVEQACWTHFPVCLTNAPLPSPTLQVPGTLAGIAELESCDPNAYSTPFGLRSREPYIAFHTSTVVRTSLCACSNPSCSWHAWQRAQLENAFSFAHD